MSKKGWLGWTESCGTAGLGRMGGMAVGRQGGMGGWLWVHTSPLGKLSDPAIEFKTVGHTLFYESNTQLFCTSALSLLSSSLHGCYGGMGGWVAVDAYKPFRQTF